MTAPALVGCDQCVALAVVERYYVVDQGGPDEHGETIAVCADPTCDQNVWVHIDAVGVYAETVNIVPDSGGTPLAYREHQP